MFEGSFHISIPRGLVLLLTELRQNSKLDFDLRSTAQISDVFCPSFLKRKGELISDQMNSVQLSLDPLH